MIIPEREAKTQLQSPCHTWPGSVPESSRTRTHILSPASSYLPRSLPGQLLFSTNLPFQVACIYLCDYFIPVSSLLRQWSTGQLIALSHGSMYSPWKLLEKCWLNNYVKPYLTSVSDFANCIVFPLPNARNLWEHYIRIKRFASTRCRHVVYKHVTWMIWMWRTPRKFFHTTGLKPMLSFAQVECSHLRLSTVPDAALGSSPPDLKVLCDLCIWVCSFCLSQMWPMNPGQFNYSASGWGNGSAVKRANCFQRTSVQLPASTSCSSQPAPRGSNAPFWPVRALHAHMHIPTQIGIFKNNKRNCFFIKSLSLRQ